MLGRACRAMAGCGRQWSAPDARRRLLSFGVAGTFPGFLASFGPGPPGSRPRQADRLNYRLQGSICYRR